MTKNFPAALNAPYDFGQPVNFLVSVIERQRGADGAFHTKAPQNRLGAVMSGAYGDAETVSRGFAKLLPGARYWHDASTSNDNIEFKRSKLLVLIILAYFDILEHSGRVVSQHRQRAVQRNQVRGDRFVIDAHKPDRKSQAQFAGLGWYRPMTP